MPLRSATSIGKWPGNTPNSPSTLGAVTSSTSAASTRPRGVTTSRSILLVPSAMTRRSLGLRELRGLRLHLLDVADEIEGLLGVLGVLVVLPVEDLLEALDR